VTKGAPGDTRAPLRTAPAMIRFLSRRFVLALVTLFLLSIIVFVGAQVLPGNPGRAILGPFADAGAVTQLNQELGYDQPLLTRYWDWLSGFLTGDMGTSYVFNAPVSGFIGDELVNSLKLAALVLVIVIPLGILGGVVAALKVGKVTDRAITVTGLSLAVVPEFVTGIVLILVFAIWLGWLPTTATAPAGSGFFTTIEYLLLPALAFTFILFGYIARMARAGTVTALDADYTRTAALKGLPQHTVVRRHVLRNSLLPTITVIAVQAGFMIGGLVVIERLFNYQGMGLLIFNAATRKDFPMLQSAVLVVGIIFVITTLAADILYSVLNPRIRVAGAAE
jgi:peptide/nickel transport system permease protein